MELLEGSCLGEIVDLVRVFNEILQQVRVFGRDFVSREKNDELVDFLHFNRDLLCVHLLFKHLDSKLGKRLRVFLEHFQQATNQFNAEVKFLLHSLVVQEHNIIGAIDHRLET